MHKERAGQKFTVCLSLSLRSVRLHNNWHIELLYGPTHQNKYIDRATNGRQHFYNSPSVVGEAIEPRMEHEQQPTAYTK